MCTPTAIGVGSLVMSAVGAGASAYSQYRQGQAQASQAQYQARLAARNARQAEMQAADARERGAEEAALQRRQTARTLGAQRSLLAASGVDLSDTDSSAMNILGDTAQWGEFDAQKAAHQYNLQGWAYENQATSERINSALFQSGAKQASRAGAIGAGASLLSGATRVADRWRQYNSQSWGK